MENNEQIAEELMETINTRIGELSDLDYCEVLEELSSTAKIQADCKREELEREN